MDIEFHLETLSEYAVTVHRDIVHWGKVSTCARLLLTAGLIVAAYFLPVIIQKYCYAKSFSDAYKMADKYPIVTWGLITFLGYSAISPVATLVKIHLAPNLYVVERLTEMDIDKTRRSYDF